MFAGFGLGLIGYEGGFVVATISCLLLVGLVGVDDLVAKRLERMNTSLDKKFDRVLVELESLQKSRELEKSNIEETDE